MTFKYEKNIQEKSAIKLNKVWDKTRWNEIEICMKKSLRLLAKHYPK